MLPGEGSELYSPIGLRLIDELTGAAPIGWTRAALDIKDGATWRETDIACARTPGSVIAYPGLERRAEVVGVPPRRYRVRISTEFYRPLYLLTQDGIEFDAPPYNDTNPPSPIAMLPWDVKLAPAPNYPFPAHVAVLRGIVIDAIAGMPVTDAEVMVLNLDRVLTGDDGLFALPLRFTPLNVSLPIDATDLRTLRTGTTTVTLPGALGLSQTITIS
jgi:hypothetical protein